ncbi:MAG: hypothetical protein AAFQ37_03950, partial [Bacteroidota bacterium]
MRIAFIILLLLSGLPQVQSGGFNSRSLGSLIVDRSNSLIVGNITLKSPISNRQSLITNLHSPIAHQTSHQTSYTQQFTCHPDTLDPTVLPPYEVVLDSLLERYYPDCRPNEYLAISRQPGGYYVGLCIDGATYPEESFLYWAEGSNEPEALPFTLRTNQIIPHYNTELVGTLRIKTFKRYRYFGYPDYTEDSIFELETLQNKPIYKTKQLARVYADHAMNLLNNQYGYSAAKNRFVLDEDNYEKLSPQQLRIYLSYHRRSLELYASLPSNEPTPVGDIRTKYGNEIINGYLTLLRYSTKEVADTQVENIGGLYDEHLLHCAMLLLESCPQNSVLITEGDNDTYPLIYLQLTKGLRNDVLVVNRHLLHFPRYVQALRLGLQVGGKLPLATPDSTIRSWQDLSFLPGERYKLGRPEEVLDVLADVSQRTKNEGNIARLPFGGIQLFTDPTGPIFRPESSVLHLGDLVMLDLIANNQLNRPVAVAASINQDYFAYANSWQQYGLAYDLRQEKPNYPIDLVGTLSWS